MLAKQLVPFLQAITDPEGKGSSQDHIITDEEIEKIRKNLLATPWCELHQQYLRNKAVSIDR